jgi:hypothetical protein
MKMNTRNRRDINDTSRVGCSSVFFKEGGQAENCEIGDGDEAVDTSVPGSHWRRQRNWVSKAMVTNENEHVQ